MRVAAATPSVQRRRSGLQDVGRLDLVRCGLRATALTRSQPGRSTIVSLLHPLSRTTNAKITSGSRAATSVRIETIRFFARPGCERSGKADRPRRSRPARPPSESRDERSRPTLRRTSGAVAGQTLRRFTHAVEAHRRVDSASASACSIAAARRAAHHPNHLQDLVDASLIERDHRSCPGESSSAADVGLQVGKREHEVGIQRLDLVEARVDERQITFGFSRASGGRTV